MKLHSKKYLAYLVALSVFFSYIETILPHFVPFLRLGLGNIVVLSSFGLDIVSFIFLLLCKSFLSSLFSGTLFSPFVLFSFSQGVVSGVLMYLLRKFDSNEKVISVYGISVLGSALSGLIQITLSSVYLGNGVYNLLGMMLLFSLFSGLFTAFVSKKIMIRETAPILIFENSNKNFITKKDKIEVIINILIILLCTFAVIFIYNFVLLATVMIISFCMQYFSGRKIKITIHIFMWIFIIITGLLSPFGKVLFSIFNFDITEGALIQSLIKCMRLSSLMALSLSFHSTKFSPSSFVFYVQCYLSSFMDAQKNQQGNFLQKILSAVKSDTFTVKFRSNKKGKQTSYYIFSILLLLLFVYDLVLR